MVQGSFLDLLIVQSVDVQYSEVSPLDVQRASPAALTSAADSTAAAASAGVTEIALEMRPKSSERVLAHGRRDEASRPRLRRPSVDMDQVKISSSKAPQTFQDLANDAAAWPELTTARRRVLQAHIRTAAFIAMSNSAGKRSGVGNVCRADVRLASVSCDVAWLNDHLFNRAARCVGLSQRGFDNTITGLRLILRRNGLLDTRRPPTGDVWNTALGALGAQKYCKIALATFAGWCEQHGITPASVSRQTFVEYETHVRSRQIRGDIPRVIRTVTKAWRKAAPLIGDGANPAVAPKVQPQRYTLQWTAFPESFQEDVAVFERRIAGGGRRGPFRGDGPRRPLRPSSVDTRMYNLRQAASALAQIRGGTSSIINLNELVIEESFESILTYFWRRAVDARVVGRVNVVADVRSGDQVVTAQTGAIGSALMMVAKYHCKLDEKTLEPLKTMAADMRPGRQTELTQKNIDRLRQFDNQLVRAQLLHLPELLMQRAEELLSPKTGVTKPFRAARMARVAVAIEILLNIPLRIGNLVNLRLGEHLRYIDTRTRRFTSLAVQCHETKNHRDIEWEISKELDHFLQRYIKRFRAILGTEEGNCLFPAGFGRRGSLSEEAMAANLKQVIAEEIGATVNPHLFRCFAAKLILEDNPGALEDVRQILGDKTLAIVLAHYAAMQPALAARRHGALLRKIRVSALSTRNEPKVKARMVKL